MRKLTRKAVLALLIFLNAQSVVAASPAIAPNPASTPNVGTQQSSGEHATIDELLKSLSEERQILERQADRQYDGLESLVNRALGLFGVIGTIAVALLGWFFGQTKREFRKTLGKSFEIQAKKIIENEAEQLSQLCTNLRAEVDDLSAYKRRQITWVSKPNVPNLENLVNALRASGIQNVSFVTPESGEDFEIGDPDLVILTFDGSNEIRRILSIIVDRLKQQSPPVPLLVYTYSSGSPQVRLEDADLHILNGFDWYIPVNFPAQVLTQALTLLRRSRSALGGYNG